MTKKKEVKKFEGNDLVLHNAFGTYYEQLEAMELADKDAVFPLESKKDAKAYRSYVSDMRKSKKPVKDAAKKAKEDAIALQKAVIAGEKEIIGRIDTMIEGHMDKIEAYESIEKKKIEDEQNRKNDIKARIESIKGHIDNDAFISGISSEDASEWLKNVEAIEVDDTFDEFKEEAEDAKKETVAKLKAIRENALKSEREKAELEKLRRETEEQKRALEKQRLEQEAKEKAELEARESIERAEREKAEAEQARIQTEQRAKKEAEAAARKAEEDKQAAVEAERQRAEHEKAEQERIEQERTADEEHRANIHSNIHKSLVSAGVSEPLSKWFVDVLQVGAIPHVKVQY